MVIALGARAKKVAAAVVAAVNKQPQF